MVIIYLSPGWWKLRIALTDTQSGSLVFQESRCDKRGGWIQIVDAKDQNSENCRRSKVGSIDSLFS